MSLVSIASANGLAATARAYQLMQAGSEALHAVVEGVTLVEDDANDLTVGYGGLPNEAGVVELDAAVMHGPTHRAGAVAALRNVRHAARLAKLVLEQTNHVLLAGEGALSFARAQGFPEENLLTERSRKIWLYWRQTHANVADWVAPPLDQLDPDVASFFKVLDDHDPAPLARSEADHRPTGTIHCSGCDGHGDMSSATTTSGLAFKLPGRVGDSPQIGAGLYVDNEFGSCGSTGRGECNVQNCSSFAVVELLRQGRSPEEAGLEVMRRVVKHTTQPHLLRPDGRPNFGLKFYVLRKDGTHAGVSLWGPSRYAVTDAQGSRLADCQYLFDRRG